MGPGAMELKINKYWLIAHDAEPSNVLWTQTVDPSTLLCNIILTYTVESSTVL